MKATGIVRRIDDLGRVVIPKEIRRTMRIREGDPLEIFTSAEGEVVFKKYSSIGEMRQLAKQITEMLLHTAGLTSLVCDREHVVAVAGIARKEIIERRITSGLERVMETRRPFVQLQNESMSTLLSVEGIEKYAAVAMPILSGGDVSGAVVLLTDEKTVRPSELDGKLAAIAAGFLAKQTED